MEGTEGDARTAGSSEVVSGHDGPDRTMIREAGPRAAWLVRGRATPWLLAAAVLAGLVVRWQIQSSGAFFVSDSFQQILIAESLQRGDGFSSGGSEHPDLCRPPLFSLLLAVAGALIGNTETAARALVLLSSALLVVPLFRMAGDLFGPAAALAVLPLGALSCLAASGARMLNTSVFALLMLWAAAACWRACRAESRWGLLIAGLLAGLAALTRPEGVVVGPVLAAFAAIPRRRWRSLLRSPRRVPPLAAPSLVLAGFVLAYAPYVAWASGHLGRFVPVPGAQYVSDMRLVSDRLGLRWVPGPFVPWAERSRSLLTADHSRLVLETYFLTGIFPDPDPAEIATKFGTSVKAPIAYWGGVLRRRLGIVLSNLKALPSEIRADHFAPMGVTLLAALGALAAMRDSRRRRGLAFVALMAVCSLAPIASHTESRFFFPPFAFALLIAANGWGSLGRVLARVRAPARVGLIGAGHLTIAAAVVLPGFQHEPDATRALARQALLRHVAAELVGRLPVGAVLAIQPQFPYWSHHPYRGLPIGGLQAALDFAHAQGASSLVIEGTRDLRLRPGLQSLTSDAVRFSSARTASASRRRRSAGVQPRARRSRPLIELARAPKVQVTMFVVKLLLCNSGVRLPLSRQKRARV
jgi:4-amino-4-deoxy-L-arabinose transferase-like glycosyltransferase